MSIPPVLLWGMLVRRSHTRQGRIRALAPSPCRGWFGGVSGVFRRLYKIRILPSLPSKNTHWIILLNWTWVFHGICVSICVISPGKPTVIHIFTRVHFRLHMYSTLLYRPSTVCFLPKFHRISPHAFDQALQCALVFGNVFFLWSNHKRFVKNGRLYHSIGSISCIQRQEHRVRMLIDLVVLRRVWNRLFRMALAEYLSLFIQKQLSHWSESAEASCRSARFILTAARRST